MASSLLGALEYTYAAVAAAAVVIIVGNGLVLAGRWLSLRHWLALAGAVALAAALHQVHAPRDFSTTRRPTRYIPVEIIDTKCTGARQHDINVYA
jgi:hypothetical protein